MKLPQAENVLRSNPAVALWNIALVYLVMMLCRVIFLLVHWGTFASGFSTSALLLWLRGALVFDTSAILYLNSAYLVLVLLPLHLKERRGFHRFLHWLFTVTNSLAVVANLMDTVFFSYNGRRVTSTVFKEFSAETNLPSIFATELVNSWYLLLAAIVLILALHRLYARPRISVYRTGTQYYVSQTLALLVVAPLSVIGMRGSASAGTKPIAINHASQYTNRPIESALVLNTPFSLLSSITNKPFTVPNYMTDAQMQLIYSPVHKPYTGPATGLEGKNIVILIVESMGKEYIGTYNRYADPKRHYISRMPFIDSIAQHSLTYTYSYANGRISMDAMPSVLTGLPGFVEPIFVTEASYNAMLGLPALLGQQGYSSAFFHGGHNVSMGFSAFARHIGFQRYYGLDEYCADPKYDGMNDFDGKWAIWDEPFLQFMADRLATLPQPFVAGAFTASSHHPFHVPKQYEKVFPHEGRLPIYHSIRYTDMALRRFFQTVSKQPWYRNTIFVIVADHTSLNEHAIYRTDLGLYSIPIIFYTPDGSLRPARRSDQVAQQTDITPTLLGMVGNRKPYLAFGCDLLHTPAQDTWAVNYNNGVYQYLQGTYMLQWDGERTIALYDYRNDPLLRHNLIHRSDLSPTIRSMEIRLKAIVRQYMQRMSKNRLLP